MSPGDTLQTSSPRRSRALFVAALVAAVALVAIAVLLALDGDDSGETKAGAAREVSLEELRKFSAEKGNPVYWAGEIPGTKLEFTDTTRGHVFVRYLPDIVPIGDEKPLYTTVATYPQPDALGAVRKAGRARGNQTKGVPGGGLATWNRARPSSVYVAFPGIDFLVEVFHPQASTARDLAVSGRIAPASS